MSIHCTRPYALEDQGASLTRSPCLCGSCAMAAIGVESGMLGRREQFESAHPRTRRDGAAVEMFDILAPVLMIAGAIAVVALVYLLFATLKDRNARKGDEERGR